MEINKRKFPSGDVVKAIAITSFLFIVGCIIVWIWVGEVRTKCSDEWTEDYSGRIVTKEHWHCTVGTENDIAFWNLAYGMMWKFSISLLIVGAIAAVGWIFTGRRY